MECDTNNKIGFILIWIYQIVKLTWIGSSHKTLRILYI